MQNEKGSQSLWFVEKVSKLLDSQFQVGKFRFGLDPIINLIPFAGDGASALMSVALIVSMKKHGASGKLIAKMLGNVFLDFIIGAIPLIGWVFDFYYKANNRNLKLLKEHYAEGKHTGSATPYISFLLILFVLFIGLGLWGIWELSKWVWNLF